MVEGHDGIPAAGGRKAYPWTDIFRCFQVALDPRKLLVAAAGILAMSLGWWLLSNAFYYPKPLENASEYTDPTVLKRLFPAKADKSDYTEAERLAEGKKLYDADFAQWRVLDDLAGPNGGKLRTMPWYEDRGENPYLFATSLAGSPASSWFDSIFAYLKSQTSVLAEPLFKLLLPVIKVVDPNAGFWTRVYLLLVIVWGIVVWAFCGGVITRIAAVQLSGKDRVTLQQAVKYVASRYLSYVLSPLVPLGVVAAVVVGLMLLGLVALIPILGDVLYGLGLPLVLVGGVIMAILLIGLVGYPMMYTTLSAEGSDTFDALSRSYNYVFQAPWQYLWYSLVAVLYGAAVTFFIVFVGSLTVYLGKWAITQTPLSEYTNQRPDYLFVYAPEAFGWKDLLLKGSPIEVKKLEELPNGPLGRKIISYPYADPARAEAYKASYQPWNKLGAGLATVWLVLTLLVMIGFGYSYFWSAMTMIYLLMRKHVDDVELDEVYLEDDTPVAPLPASAPAFGEKPGAMTLPMTPAVPAVPPPPVAFTGPVAALGAPPAPEKPAGDPPAGEK